MKICDAIESAEEGDEVLVATRAAAELAERARDRLRPGLGLVFQVEELPNPFELDPKNEGIQHEN